MSAIVATAAAAALGSALYRLLSRRRTAAFQSLLFENESNAVKAALASLPDAIIVLGGGRPSTPRDPPKWVKARCDAAARLYKAVLNARGVRIPIVPISAGTALLTERGLPVWESAASAAYLVSRHGVDPDSIYMETTSYDTIGNAYFTRVQICDVKGWEKVWVVTSEFHMARTRAIFEWIFAAEGGPAKRRYRMNFFSSDNVGISEAGIKERKARESRSLVNVQRLAKIHKTLRSTCEFLFKMHRMYAVSGLGTYEKVSEELKKSY